MRPMGPAHRAWLQHWQHIGASSICCPRACVCLRAREWVCVCARTLACSTPISIICWTPVPLCPLIRLEKTHQMACGEKKIINRQQGKRRHPQPWQGSQRFKAYMTYFEHTNVDTRAHTSSCLTCGNGTCWRKKRQSAANKLQDQTLLSISDVFSQHTLPWLCDYELCQCGHCLHSHILLANRVVGFIYSPAEKQVSEGPCIKRTQAHIHNDAFRHSSAPVQSKTET